jgi:glucose repression regulatory protein TUP1
MVLAILEPESIDTCVASVAISPDGRWVAAGSLDSITRVWDLRSGALVERLHGHRDSVYSVMFSPDGRGLVTWSLDKTSKYWDITPMVRAVNAGNWRGLADRVSLRQDGISASNELPIPGGKKEGGGEMGSICTAVFSGHKVHYLRHLFILYRSFRSPSGLCPLGCHIS